MPGVKARGAKARIGMDEDKPRKRDMQRKGLASAKRNLAHDDIGLGGAPYHVRPQGALGDFFAAVRL
jgi:hypothetical protein